MRSVRATASGPLGKVSSGTSPAAITRALRESLESLASEVVASQILVHAIEDGGYAQPPESLDELDAFVNGPLRAEATAVLGQDAWESIHHQLEPLLARMRHAARAPSPTPHVPSMRPIPAERAAVPSERAAVPSERPAGPTPLRPLSESPGARRPSTPTPPRHTAAPRVTLALVTEDAMLVDAVARAFPEQGLVVFSTLDARATGRVVVLDARERSATAPMPRAAWSSTLAPRTVVLWPATPAQRVEFEQAHPDVRVVVSAGREVDRADLLLLLASCLTA